MKQHEFSRRDALRLGAFGAAGLGAAGVAGLPVLGSSARTRDRFAPSTAAAKAKLTDIEHVVVIIQENRSFDHYFGVRKNVRGFADTRVQLGSTGKPIWYQPSNLHSDGYLLPFHVDSINARGQCGTDPGHTWLVQHGMRNNGAMDQFAQWNKVEAMGYLTREDIPWYYGMADHFTVCDAWFCSVLGPTNPNRYYSISATIDPAGTLGGGPANFNSGYWYTWETYPERLERAGVSWRMYHDVDDFDDNMLKNFRNFQGLEHKSSLWHNAMKNRTVEDFIADVDNGNLPQVSYIIAPAALSEHPSWTPVAGEEYVRRHVEALMKNTKVWSKTAVLLTYDENGGFFDHVAPPVPEPGTAGEFIGSEPIGLGFRVPGMVISPWSTSAAGGRVVSDTFDHTSILRFLETRFGVEVPNLTKWRRDTCGDLTSCFDFDTFDTSYPKLPSTAELADTITTGCTDRPPNAAPSVQAVPTVEA